MPDNTPETEAGTLVKIPDKWLIQTPSYVENGKEVISSKQIATVNAVGVGNGEVVPVPIGFYYVGGSLTTGVVISDNEADKNKFAGREDVPSGLKLNEEGNIEYEIVGNQFVWVPCELEEYVKTNWGQGNVTAKSNSCWDTTIDDAGKMQTEKYGGFYVARFEAGLDSNIEEFTTKQQHTQSNQVYNKEGIPQSKPGIVPWSYIDWNHAQANSERMYHTSTARSGLITGTQWDVMINWMTNKNEVELTNSFQWGNYPNSTPNIALGRLSNIYASSNVWYQDSFSNTWEVNSIKPLGVMNASSGKGYMWTTGASEEAKKKNLYDVAGNCYEWTKETAFYGGNTATQYQIYRGSGCSNSNSYSIPVYHRFGDYSVGKTGAHIGFRVVLYIR